MQRLICIQIKMTQNYWQPTSVILDDFIKNLIFKLNFKDILKSISIKHHYYYFKL